MSTAAPIELRLRVDPGPTLTAELHNASPAPLSVVTDSVLQPAELVLTGPSGAVTPFDTREIQKFDNTVHEASFTTVAPGATVPLGTGKVTGSGGNASLQWGPFRFESLPPGAYRAKVVLKSTITEYVDDAGQRVKKADAWTGTVTSPEVALQVP